MATLKLDGVRFIVTMDPERRIIRDGAVVLDGKRIVEVGKAAELQHVGADRVIDAREMVLTPGFCNGHMHISYAHATRGIFPDDIGNQYLPNVFRLQGVMTPEEEYYTSLLGITELLKYGTTCFLDPGSTKHLHACMEAYEQAGCRIIVGAHVTDREKPDKSAGVYDGAGYLADVADYRGVQRQAGRAGAGVGDAFLVGFLFRRVVADGQGA